MSKELEALREIKEIYELAIKAVNDNDNEKLTVCEVKRFELIEKSLKALEIIKEKKVNIHSWYYNNCNKIPYEIYKQSIMVKSISSELLTQEEYDLLKEIFK